MNRRSFLGFLGLAPIVGPAVVNAAATAPEWRITASYVRGLQFPPLLTAKLDLAALNAARALLDAADLPPGERWAYIVERLPEQ